MNQLASTFSAVATVKKAWAQVKGCKGTFWLVMLGVIVIYAIRTVLDKMIVVATAGIGLLLAVGLIKLVLYILYILLIWGAIYLGIQRAKAQLIQAKLVGYVFDIVLFFKMIGLYLLQILIFLPLLVLILLPNVLLGPMGNLSNLIQMVVIIICAVIAIFLVMRLYLAKALVIAEKINPWQAIKRSFQVTRSHVWQLIGLSLINMGILLLGALTLGIGLIWAIPYWFINYGVVYHQLTARENT